ncbi:outer membrane beta-barrel protein [Hymenobacter sp. H14-R3]|uniref:outer membrane beta-barrel protein n=1 Tax=Hymenobacter sp. H14-R3 TaxID=3046308 RepID=UPI0024B9D6F4|nr:outer membrane beta-barrel protein [Hymenobacter sp. H14-R3]MDJ0366544.1 outer membrane beta-barrel protein [Hymenobacter sp. H14-R3]
MCPPPRLAYSWPDEAAWQRYEPRLQHLEVPAKTVLLREGVAASQFYYLEQDRMRSWFEGERQAITTQFFFESQPFASLKSFTQHNGKQTCLTGEALSQYLKSLPASAISRVELLPNPPASLDVGARRGARRRRQPRRLPGHAQPWRHVALNLNYRWALDTLGRELTAGADLMQGTTAGHQDFLPLNTPPTGAVGASWVTSRRRLAFEKLGAAANEWRPDSTRTNQFRYEERIAAGYFTLSTTLKKLELKAGLRGEHTHSGASRPPPGSASRATTFSSFRHFLPATNLASSTR